VKLKATGGGQTTAVSIDLDGKVSDLKAAVEAATGIPPENQRLIYTGKLLKNGADPLAPFGIKDGDTILYMRMNPPRSASAPRAPAASAAAAPAPSPAPAPAQRTNRLTIPAHQRTPFTHAVETLAADDAAKRPEALRTLLKVMENIQNNPLEAKYRTLKKGNAVFNRRLGGVMGAAACLRVRLMRACLVL